VDELATAKMAGDMAREAAAAGVSQVAEGSVVMGAGMATEAMGEALT
jgi:hypothetical protein